MLPPLFISFVIQLSINIEVSWKNIKNYINENHLNVYIFEIEKVFGEYDEHNVVVHFFDCFIIFIIQVFIGLLSSGEILLNIISLYSNKKIFVQILLFIGTIVIGYYEFYNAIFEVKTDLNLTDSELEKFKEIRAVIESKLLTVKIRVFFLRICPVVLIITSIINIVLNVYIIIFIKKLDNGKFKEDMMNNFNE